MGLDMYLSKKFFIWNKDNETLKITGGRIPFKGDKVKYIIEEAGYWRKANAIHQWFVENVQDGKDDCKDYYVSQEQMGELLDLVKKVLADHSKAEELLPTTSGFFFGGTEYDEYYFQSLEETKTILEEALQDDREPDFEYSSSW